MIPSPEFLDIKLTLYRKLFESKTESLKTGSSTRNCKLEIENMEKRGKKIK